MGELAFKMVLILVVVEDSLWPASDCLWGSGLRVLILVVVEDSLWPYMDATGDDDIEVLILVVVEDSLWQRQHWRSNQRD